MDPLLLWRRYKDTLCECPSLGLKLDISRMSFDDQFFARMDAPMNAAFDAMARLEAGELANPDEQRMVGHYWLRSPMSAPADELTKAIEQTLHEVMAFAGDVHSAAIKPAQTQRYTDVVVIGIGGSALGPQLLADALGNRKDRLDLHFLDNTDPDGFDRVLESLGARIKSTLFVVISKSGGTKETRNGMIEAEEFLRRKGLSFASQAVAVTGAGSQLDQIAEKQGWLRRFPMWDWVGGRTSVMSAVGLVPAALQGLDIPGLLDGAAEMDKCTRVRNTRTNPAARLALMWWLNAGPQTQGRAKDMVIIPYKDRLLLFSRYLQQLIMESLGKELDLNGNVVNQGIAVYGNKGSTDQHAYVQQLRDGLHNFFATFIVAMNDRVLLPGRTPFEVEPGSPGNPGIPGVTSGDYLHGFWLGTRQALFEKGRESITISVEKFDARALGALIALFERAVGFYASLVNINAYHQPGVEAGKKAAAAVLELQGKVVAYLKANPELVSAEQIADRMGLAPQVETIQHLLDHLAANKRGIVSSRGRFRWKEPATRSGESSPAAPPTTGA